MYAIKVELKLNNKEKTLMAKHAGKKIKIPTLGTFRLLEELPCRYVTQTFTISRTANKWYVSFSVDAEKLPPRYHDVVDPVGIDLGVKTLATLSDGTTYIKV